MRLGTVLLSATIHVGLAVGLISAQHTRELKKKTISVAVTGEKKKDAKPKPPPPPAPPRRSAPKTVATLPKAEVTAPAHAAAPAPVATNLTMSNEDIGPGIGLAGAAPRGAARAAPAAMKVASAISDRRTRMAREEAEGTAGEGSCNEPPTEPIPVVTTEINYSLYPQAQQDGIEGLFKARIVVGADGDVVDVQVVSGVDPAFDAAIKAALMRWRFKPSTMCGKPVAGGVHKFKARFELAD